MNFNVLVSHACPFRYHPIARKMILQDLKTAAFEEETAAKIAESVLAEEIQRDAQEEHPSSIQHVEDAAEEDNNERGAEEEKSESASGKDCVGN